MHDDIFVILSDFVKHTPLPLIVLFFILVTAMALTVFKTWIDERKRAEEYKFEHPRMPHLCSFPLCGKTLEGVPKNERVYGNHSDLPYCSKMCVKRDWEENNHKSVVLLLKRRKTELEKENREFEESCARPWLQQLADTLPNPKAGFGPEGVEEANQVFSVLAVRMETEAAQLTARTFAVAYMRRFGLHLFTWVQECLRASGRGCVLVHLSERAIEDSSGAPISYVPQRILLRLDDYDLNKLVREYDPERELVLYVMLRGMQKPLITKAFRFTVKNDANEKPEAESKRA